MIKISGYTFVPVNVYVTHIISVAVIFWCAGRGCVRKNENTNKTSMPSAILPVLAIFFVVAQWVASDSDTGSIFVCVMHACITLICSMVLFFSYTYNKAVKIGLGIIYSLMVISFFFLLSIMILIEDFCKTTVVESEISPNAVYIAKIIDIDEGALGGSTVVTVTNQKFTLHLLVGEIKKAPEVIYRGRWGEFRRMILRWETDDILYINEKRYEIARS